MDENTKPTKAEDMSDAKGLKSEGIDILPNLANIEDNNGEPSLENVNEELSPVFPEDSHLGGFIKDNLEEAKEVQKKVEEVKPAPVVSQGIRPSIPTFTPQPTDQERMKQEMIGNNFQAHNDPSIKPLRTYKTDAEEAIQNQHVSVASMVVAENKKREEAPVEPTEEKKKTPWLAVIGSIFFLVLGAGGIYYVYSLQGAEPTTTEPVVEQKSTLPSIIKSDKQIELAMDASQDPLADFATQAVSAAANVGSIVYFYPTITTSGTKALMTGQQFFTKAEVNMPARLMRSLGDQFMLGTYVFDGNTPFIILKNTFYQNAYSGMLEWERNMPNDLINLVLINSTGKTLKPNFEDSVVRNKDVRVLKTTDETNTLLYVFIDQNTILITTNQKGLEGLIDKMTTARVIQ